ncbi:MAG: NUDIX domain-containing protein [Thauera sp.]|jgi:ADP-ribose pyrophosphatase YjhB (NUDIX family)|nr:NUDIX domain-containing protein [Thauera sp.]
MQPAGIPTGVHVLCEREGQILLMRRAGTGFFDGCYSLPGGHLEVGESVLAAAVRELREETALEASVAALDWLGVVHRRSDTSRIDFFVRARQWRGEARIAESDKCDRLGWYARDDLPEPLVAYVRVALQQVQPPWVLELGWSD